MVSLSALGWGFVSFISATTTPLKEKEVSSTLSTSKPASVKTSASSSFESLNSRYSLSQDKGTRNRLFRCCFFGQQYNKFSVLEETFSWEDFSVREKMIWCGENFLI